ncbi:S8 family peptidase [Aspergillus vadensis CBS 113365]|uniref:Subtilisin-like protein n=1 Tax=Aspergillus vadensis (strain CBS 113365 / IMI 142717 / IBT 24658) TaxID=1448311 RepID=A0A319CBZ9_ASPVC|nr:subtilisin-like protein [Aspergillus vadensis CBS 113365]PYH72818.1 subtilisin-like protein [Aspergillus vadensis CBS 113365]
MASEDPIDFAHTAIAQVANIASLLGVESKRPLCGRLGAELFLVANYIDTAGLDQESRLRLRISKLLRDVEAMCNWPTKIPRNDYPLLEAITKPFPDVTSYETAQRKIRRGLDQLTACSRDAEVAISHIQKFVERNRKSSRRDESGDISSRKRAARPERSDLANELAHRVLREQMCCTCQTNGVRRQTERGHLVCLLLQPPSQSVASDNLVQFDMLFSSEPFWNQSQLTHWQDIELLVPNDHTHGKKCVRFFGRDDGYRDEQANNLSAKIKQRTDKGQFCRLLDLAKGWRLCLSIEDQELYHFFEPHKQKVDHIPGISLAKVLSTYHLTSRMKLVLAYIIAYSVWQYYDTDWMRTKWTSETIQFMRESDTSGGRGQGKLFTWKPYVSVHFNDEDPLCYEQYKVPGMVHVYPRIRALGIMLVEIGLGFPLPKRENQGQSLAAEVNAELLTAINYARDEERWKNFDYPDYMNSIRHCLEPGTFDQAACVEGLSAYEQRQHLKQRRNILYEKVVFPLENLLQGTKWIDNYEKIAPLSVLSQDAKIEEATVPENLDKGKAPERRRKRTESEKNASNWLLDLKEFNRELAQVAPAAGSRGVSRSVRIAILDTGYDDNAPFFFSPDVMERLKGWKDWVDGSSQPEDCHGHGTHLVSLVLKCAPDADIYVARISESPHQLLNSSDKVAEAISWASGEWKADIISMSFGFADEQPCISDAIREALYKRQDSVLFFAAASNYGANDREMFPARHESVISIRGTNSNGLFADFNPPKHEDEPVVFGTLGMDVPSAWPNSDGEEYRSGTSVATAIAAGIAGSLLGYISSRPPEKPFYNAKNRAWTRRGMNAIFRAISSNTLQSGYLYLTVRGLIGIPEDARWAKIGGKLSGL